MAHSYRLGLVTWGNQVRMPVGTYICHRGCAYTVLQTVQRHGGYSAAHGTVHYKEPLKSIEIRVGHSPEFRLSSVAILLDVKQTYKHTHLLSYVLGHIVQGSEAILGLCLNEKYICISLSIILGRMLIILAIAKPVKK